MRNERSHERELRRGQVRLEGESKECVAKLNCTCYTNGATFGHAMFAHMHGASTNKAWAGPLCASYNVVCKSVLQSCIGDGQQVRQLYLLQLVRGSNLGSQQK